MVIIEQKHILDFSLPAAMSKSTILFYEQPAEAKLKLFFVNF